MKKTDYYTDEKTLSQFENIYSTYKQKNSPNFKYYSQLMIQHSFLFSLDYVCINMGQKVKKLYLVNAFPVIETNGELILTISYLDDKFMQGISKGNTGINIPLENILYDFYQLKEGKQLKAKVIVVNYYSSCENRKSLKETETCFGKMFVKEPYIISIDELKSSINEK